MKSVYLLLLYVAIAQAFLFAVEIKKDPISHLNYITTIVSAPQGQIIVEIADSDLKHALGLSFRQNLPEGRGMLFPVKTPSEKGMWMKDMNFPIDILWLDSDKKVTLIKPHVSPDSYGQTESIVYHSAKPDTLYVLEIPAGSAHRFGIKVGTKLVFEL